MENVVIVEHSTGHKHIPLNSPKFSVGRGLDNSHVVDDISVSRKHAVFELKNNEWYIFDLSVNGTWVNENLIGNNGSIRLQNGDTIKLSSSCCYTFKTMATGIPSSRVVTEEEIIAVAEEVAKFAEEFSVDFTESDVASLPLEPNASLCNELVDVASNPNNAATSIASNDPIVSPNLNKQAQALPCKSSSIEFAEAVLQCSICAELFVKATTLSCSHTFCSYCITQWEKSNKNDCPMCRTPIEAKCRTLILDNYIEKIMETAGDELKKHRQNIIEQRESSLALEQPSASGSNSAAVFTGSSGSSDVDDSNGEDDDYYSEECDCDRFLFVIGGLYNRGRSRNPSRPFYGGYGKCYICGQAGHWSSGCPIRRRRY